MESDSSKTRLKELENIINDPSRLARGFIVAGDSQQRGFYEYFRPDNRIIRRRMAEAILAADPGFVVLMGDVVWFGGVKAAWEDTKKVFLEPFKRRDIPVVCVVGNHELLPPLHPARLGNFFGAFPLLMGNRFYTFTWNRIRMVVLDTNLKGKEWARQEAWFRSELDNSQKDENIDCVAVFGHSPPYTNGIIVRSNTTVRRKLVPFFMEAPKTKIWFSGHNHSYEHFLMQGKHFMVTGGGGAPRFPVRIGSAAAYKDLFDGPVRRPWHFCRCAFKEHGLEIEVRGVDAGKADFPLERFEIGFSSR